MSASVRQLFRELVDVPQQERNRILLERQIPAEVIAEVMSLLQFDEERRATLTRSLSEAVNHALRVEDVLPSSCGPYQPVKLLGSGGMGDVYLAERQDGEIEQKAAVKLLRADADRPMFRERFLKERQFLANLNHPCIARLLHAGRTDDGRPYLVMEHVEGVSIDKFAEGLDLPSVLKLFLFVCDAVSHAHGQHILHRDLKPSNILVDSNGQPKLLDFGIAKLMDTSADETCTAERLLTPNYASPEQLRGGVQTTATDIYSLGAVLYELLKGHSPRQSSDSPKRELPQDIEHILRKALRDEPQERYATVDAFARDIRAFLDFRPVEARSGETWYRSRKFLRQHRASILAVALPLTGLFVGFGIASHERGIAQKRFVQVRQLANRVLLFDQTVGGLHSSSKARTEMVALSKEYLEGLGAEVKSDKELALEVGEAYSLLARAQGISVVANSGQHLQAEESLRKAAAFVEPVLASSPANRKALLTAARVSHDRMIIAETERQKSQAVTEGRKAIAYLDKLLRSGDVSEAERDAASEFLYHAALIHKNFHLPEDAIRYAHRSVEIARSLPNAERRRSMTLSLLADLKRITGDLEGALASIQEARANLDNAQFEDEANRRLTRYNVLFREGRILGASSGLCLNRQDEALTVLQEAFDTVEQWTQTDAGDAWSRLLFAGLGRELGGLLSTRDASKALVVYDHALRRVREVKDNPEARRGEVELMAGSTYVLRRLHRPSEAQERIEAAFRILNTIGEYPADRVPLHNSADALMRAWADHFAATGQLQKALEVDTQLLEKIAATKPDPKNDLRDAVGLSSLYATLSTLHRRAGNDSEAEAFASLRFELWRGWEATLPNSSFVHRQVDEALRASGFTHRATR